MSNFILTDRKTDYLLPPSVDDWLTQDHLARFVVEVIDSLDLTDLTRQYAGRGSKAHHPATLLAILVYGYSTGVFSSRKLERATYDSVAFRYIVLDRKPDFPNEGGAFCQTKIFRKSPIEANPGG
jgi:transposase